MPDRELLTVGGTEVEITRSPDKPLMLLSRMAARKAGVWDGIWDRLCTHFSVANFGIALPDQPDIDRMGDFFQEIAQTTADVAEGLGYDRFHIFGWAGGTHVALQCLADYPGKVASATLLGAFHPPADMRMVDKQLAFRQVMFTQPDRVLYAYYWYLTMFSPQWAAANFDKVEALAERRAKTDGLLARPAEEIMQWDRGLYRQWVDDVRLGAIGAPVHLIGIDANINNAGPTIEMAKSLHDKIPTSELTVLPDARAMILHEDPDRFMAAAMPFFKKVAG